MALINALKYSKDLKINCVEFWDMSHGAWNDWRATLKEQGLWGWFLVTCVSRNAFHDPWDECRFFEEMRSSANQYFDMLALTGDDCPLLSTYLSDILNDRGEADIISEPDIARTVRAELKDYIGFQRLGSKVSLNRFFGALKKYRYDVRPGWH